MSTGFWTLRRKLIVLLLCTSSLPLALTTYLVYRQGRERVTTTASSYLGTVADAAAHNLDTFNLRYQRQLVAMVAMPLVQAQCPDRSAQVGELEAQLRTVKASDSALFGLSVADASGTIVASSEQIFVGIDITDRAYYQATRAADVITTELVVSRGSNPRPAIVFALRFGAPARPCVAIVAVSADELFDNVRSLDASMGRGGYIVVVEQHGIRIAHGFRDEMLFRPTGGLPATEADQMIREGRFGVRTAALLSEVIEARYLWTQSRAIHPRRAVWRGYSPTNDEDNLIVARRLTSAPWTMFAHVPVRDVEAPLGSMVGSVALVGMVMTALAMLVGLLAARRLIAPVRELTRASRALAAGETTARAEVEVRDEIGELARRFNQAADHAASAAASLERTVADRTRELTVSNEELHRRRDQLLGHRAELIAQKEELSLQRDALAEKSELVERADRMKSEFLANMSHELRTPLNSVIGFADLLQVTAAPRLQPVERSYLGDIVTAGRHLLLIINDVLDLAKIEAGHVRLAIEAFDPDELAAGAIAMTAPLARARSIELRLTVGSRRRGRGDPDRICQVLLNLLSNAVKFSPDGARVDVRIDDAGDALVFAVTDRGPGIPAEAQAGLFQPFIQGEHPLVKRHQGTGLGLAISRKLIELHAGTLTVESVPGLGSTFRFTIAAGGRRGPATLPTSTVAVILVVAAPDAVEAHRARLEPAGYRVVAAAPVADLTAAAGRAGAALIVIDVGSLPDRAIADAMLVEAPKLSQRIPVILLSGEPQVLATKPIDGAALQAICRQLARRDDGPAQLLVVDDDPRVAELIAATLGDRYRIESAGTVAEGLVRARAGAHDLYVVDLMLPDGSGFEVLAALDADAALRTVPRIVLTAAELDADDRAELRRHADAVAHKGMVTPDELVHVVDRFALGRAPPLAPIGEPQILVVDDNDMNRVLMRSILERLSYRVLEARDGVEAIAIAERERPALILMDLAMPGKDGFETTRELRAHQTLRATPIVAVSAMAMRADEERARAAGVDSFLAKPIDREALERTIARYLHHGDGAA